MISGTRLTVNDGAELMLILASNLLPVARDRETGVVFLQGAMQDIVQTFPATSWRGVMEALRSPELDAHKVADWLGDVLDKPRR